MDEVAEDAKFTNMAQKRPLSQSAYWGTGEEEPSGESLSESEDQPDIVKYLGQWDISAKEANDLCLKAAGYYRSRVNIAHPELRGRRIK